MYLWKYVAGRKAKRQKRLVIGTAPNPPPLLGFYVHGRNVSRRTFFEHICRRRESTRVLNQLK